MISNMVVVCAKDDYDVDTVVRAISDLFKKKFIKFIID